MQRSICGLQDWTQEMGTQSSILDRFQDKTGGNGHNWKILCNRRKWFQVSFVACQFDSVEFKSEAIVKPVLEEQMCPLADTEQHKRNAMACAEPCGPIDKQYWFFTI